jgi:hypothetical protein
MVDAQFAAYEARCTKAAALATEILPHNKQVLFDTLSAAGIDVVTVEFDGSGDSGQFEAPAGFDANNTEVAIPSGEITMKVVDFETGTIREQTTTPRAYIETLACDFLESTHSGWEDGEGRVPLFAERANDHARLQRTLRRLHPPRTRVLGGGHGAQLSSRRLLGTQVRRHPSRLPGGPRLDRRQ